jgi:uncharacterized membrane protein YhaH (DUF805 family)
MPWRLKRFFWLYFRLDGALAAGDYTAAWLALIILFMPLSWVFVHSPALLNPNSRGLADFLTPLGWSVFLPVGAVGCWMQFALRVKRAHDLGEHWTWALPLIVRASFRPKS